MNRHLRFCLIILLVLFTLSGCWNYWSLDQMDIVVGIGIDFDKASNNYKVSYEIADLMNATKDGAINGKLIESQGKTLFDAARNAKRREEDRLFFGTAYVLIINQELAKEEGLLSLIEWFLRDGEGRETMSISISQEDSAMVILQNASKNSGIVSIAINDIISEDSKTTASSISSALYYVYNSIKSLKHSVMLPALHVVKNGDKDICELNGIAFFREDKLAGFLSPEQSKYVLFIEDQLRSGILTFATDDSERHDISLEIFKNTTKKSFVYEEGKITVKIETNTDVALAESEVDKIAMNKEMVEKIEKDAEKMIESKIKELINYIQSDYNIDLFGFGEMIYKKDIKLWKQLEPEWNSIYPTIEIEVNSKVKITNSGFVK